ncbi:MAG: efflux RND transporter periplasmic adaptor subunit [Pseudomonadota bacterium]
MTPFKTIYLPNSGTPLLRPNLLSLIFFSLILTLSGCSKPVEKSEDVRPVRVQKLVANQADVVAEFPGDVRARIESKLGFRVGGKIISRKVNMGDTVRRGEVLMALDPQDLRLAQVQANAGLQSAKSNYDLAESELRRYEDLREKNFVSQAILDAKVTAFRAAKASYDQAQAAYRGQSNQAGYATLVADVDGVVTALDAEVGQVVVAGSPVVRVAQTTDKEIVIAIPEDQVDTLRRVSDIQVRIWANPKDLIPGQLRELSPVADSGTRTYAAKIAIPSASPEVRLGMTAHVIFAAKPLNSMISVPLTAIFQDKGQSAVWAVENGAVRLLPVQIDGTNGENVLLAGGATAGQTIVTAGVNSLKQGQKVRILGEEPSVQAPKTSLPSSSPPASPTSSAGVAK